MNRTVKRTILCAVAVAILIGGICLALYLKSVADYKQAVSNIAFNNVDITRVADGRYIGECDVDFIYAKVAVTIQDGAISNIEILEHKHERGQSAEVITDRIVDEQKIEVDGIAGATSSSTVLKKAVENAISGSLV